MAVLPWLNESDKPASPYQPAMAGSMFSKSAPPLTNDGAYMSPVQDNTPASPVQTKATPRTPLQNNAQAGYYGLAAAGSVAPTPDAGEAALGAIGSGIQGAAMGASVGGPVGAMVGGGVGLVMGGLNAYLGVQSSRRAADKAEAMRQEAIRLNKEEIARDEKWRQINRLDSLEAARYQRRQFAMQQAYAVSQNQGKSLMTLIQGNQALKDHFAKFGW